MENNTTSEERDFFPHKEREFAAGSHFHLLALTCIGVLIVGLTFVSGCSNGSSKGMADKPSAKESVPVIVATVVQKPVPVKLQAIGTVQAYSTVSIKSQVNGEIIRVHFNEGQDVKKGTLLFMIDPAPFEAALRQAEGNLARDIAQAKQAEANLVRDIAQAKNAAVEAKRFADLVEKGIVAKEQSERYQTTYEALQASVQADRAAIENAEAAVRADRAAVENAKIRLGYCSIRSPINGRTGSLIVHQGNTVKADENPPLVVINQIDPIYVDFTVPERNVGEIRNRLSTGKLGVDAISNDNEKQAARGELTFVDNTVDRATGTIHLKATFPNKQRTLWPGQFVNVVLTLGEQPNAIVVPAQAVQTGQQGQYVFVVKPDLTAESRPVTIARTVESETVVAKGLAPGERVVTDGQLRLYPGAKVELKTSSPTPGSKEGTS